MLTKLRQFIRDGEGLTVDRFSLIDDQRVSVRSWIARGLVGNPINEDWDASVFN